MLEINLEGQRVERLQLQSLGEEWVRAISQGSLDAIGPLCHPDLESQLLLPKRQVSLQTASDLVSKLYEWYGECTHIQLQDSRVSSVGQRLGIFYRLLVQKHGDWFQIEQHLYGTLRAGRVQKMHLLCSGFQLVAVEQAAEPEPAADDLLELHESGEQGSICALLTPAIRTRLRGLQSGQVLEVRVADASARGDIEAWCRLSGNELLKVLDHGDGLLRFFVKKK